MSKQGQQFNSVTAEEAHKYLSALHGTEYTGERLKPTVGNPTESSDPRPEPNQETELTEPRTNKKATRKRVESAKDGKIRVTKVELGSNPQGVGRAPRVSALAQAAVHDPSGNPIKRMDKSEGASNSLLQSYHEAGYNSSNESPTDKAQGAIDFVKVKKELKGKGRIPNDFQTPTVKEPENGVRYVDRNELFESLNTDKGSIRYSKQSRDKDGNPSVARGAFAGLSARQVASDPRLRRLARIANGTHTQKDLLDMQLEDNPKAGEPHRTGMPENIPTTDQPRGSRTPKTATKTGSETSLLEHVEKHGVTEPIEVHQTPDGPRVPNPVDRMKVAAAYATNPKQSIQFKHV